MNKYFLLLSVVVCFFGLNNTNAQERSYLLDGKSKLKLSGFASYIQEFSSYNNDVALSSGGSAAVLFNQNFYVGGYGLGMISPGLDLKDDKFDDFQSDFGHGGLLIGGIIGTDKVLHLDVNTKIGFGGYKLNGDFDDFDDYDAVFVLNPEAALEINVARFFKIKGGLGYRYVTGFNSQTADDQVLNGMTGSVGLIFGWFGQGKGQKKGMGEIDNDQIKL